MPALSKEQLAYLAGIFDGEGYVTMSASQSPRYTLYVGIVNTYLPVLKLLQETFGGTLYLLKRREGQLGKLPCFSWRVSQSDALVFLEAIYLYVWIKKAQTDVAIEYLRTRKTSKSRVSTNEVAMRELCRQKIVAINGHIKK